MVASWQTAEWIRSRFRWPAPHVGVHRAWTYCSVTRELRAISPRSAQGLTMAGHPPSGTVTFLLTDLEGSTRLWERDPMAMKAAMARHDELLEKTIAAHRGFVFARMG